MRPAGLLALAACATLAAPAAAATGREVSDGAAFRVDLSAPGSDLCFILPQERAEPAACQGLEPAALRAAVGPARATSVLALAALRLPAFGVQVLVLRYGKELGELTAEGLGEVAGDFLRGGREALATRPGAKIEGEEPPVLRRVNGVQVVRQRMKVALGDGAQRMVVDTHLVLTSGSAHGVVFMADARHLLEVEPIERRVLESLRATPTRLGYPSAAHRAGQKSAPFLFFGLVLVSGLAIFIRARARRSRRRAQRTAPAQAAPDPAPHQ